VLNDGVLTAAGYAGRHEDTKTVRPLDVERHCRAGRWGHGETPPVFGGLAVVLFPVTVTCPGGAPGFFPLGMIWLSGSGNVTANGTLIQGRNDVGGGIYWSWSFARP
jgi:hypothetical protein